MRLLISRSLFGLALGGLVACGGSDSGPLSAGSTASEEPVIDFEPVPGPTKPEPRPAEPVPMPGEEIDCLPPQDCSVVLCSEVDCGPDEVAVTDYGACCSVCAPKPDCSAIRCGAPVCENGLVLHWSARACCPTCVAPLCPIDARL